MPRDGSGIYTKPYPNVVSGTTIETAVHNGTVSDIETDLNAVRPIIAGGTGASNVTAARDNLDVEVAGAEVTNYDTHVFENGSFWSQTGATGAPSLPGYPAGAGYFSGICHKLDNDTLTLVAQVYDSINNIGQRYSRQKFGGIWKPWVSEGRSFFTGTEGFAAPTADMFFGLRGTAPGSQFVINSEHDASGTDILTVTRASGVLGVYPPSFAASGSAQINVVKRASGDTASVFGMMGTSARWSLTLGDQAAESSGAIGSDFLLYRYNNSGTGLGSAFTIRRLDAAATLYGSLTTQGNISVTKTTPTLTLSKTAGTENAFIQGATNGLLRWNVAIANSTSEAGGNVGSDCAFYRYDDAGNILAGGVPALSLKRSDGSAAFGGNVVVAGNITINGANAAQVINSTAGPASVVFYLSSAEASSVYDNGGGIVVASNPLKTAGMYITHGASSWTALSDARLPEKAGALPLSMLSRIDAIHVYENEIDGKQNLFVIAQEFVECLPHLVKVGTSDIKHVPRGLDDPDAWGVNYDRAGVAALQLGKEIYAAMQQQVTALTARVEALETAATP